MVALSSCEAEYITGATMAYQGLWLLHLLGERLNRDAAPTTIYIDNKLAIALDKNTGRHERSKHNNIHYHFLRDVVNDGMMVVEYINTYDQLADVPTKLLGHERFQELRTRCGIFCVRSTQED